MGADIISLIVEDLVPVGPLFGTTHHTDKILLYIMLEQTSLVISRVGVK